MSACILDVELTYYGIQLNEVKNLDGSLALVTTGVAVAFISRKMKGHWGSSDLIFSLQTQKLFVFCGAGD